jgi:hypothetical protein
VIKLNVTCGKLKWCSTVAYLQIPEGGEG